MTLTDNPNIIDTEKLQQVIQNNKTTEGILHTLTEHVQTRAHQIRENIPKVIAQIYDLTRQKKEAKDAKNSAKEQEIQKKGEQLEKELEWMQKALDDATITTLSPFAKKAAVQRPVDTAVQDTVIPILQKQSSAANSEHKKAEAEAINEAKKI